MTFHIIYLQPQAHMETTHISRTKQSIIPGRKPVSDRYLSHASLIFYFYSLLLLHSGDELHQAMNDTTLTQNFTDNSGQIQR